MFSLQLMVVLHQIDIQLLITKQSKVTFGTELQREIKLSVISHNSSAHEIFLQHITFLTFFRLHFSAVYFREPEHRLVPLGL